MGSEPGDGTAELTSGALSAGDAPGHADDGGPADETFADVALTFVVAG